MAIAYSCTDFLGFQESLKKMRDIDDKIIYALNTSLPTESFKGQVNQANTCKNLFTQLQTSHQQRDDAIKSCIMLSAKTIKTLRDLRDSNPNDIDLNKKFKSEHRKLRILQAELNVEDIVKDRSLKAFVERCRPFVQIGSL